jgi:hypothetical protein
MQYGWAPETNDQYKKYVRYFLRWVIYMQIGRMLLNYEFMQNYALPAYIAFLGRTQVHSTAVGSLNGVRIFYESRGYANPLVGHWGLSHLLQALRRKKPGGTKQKLPIDLNVLHWIAQATDPSNAGDVAFCIACFIAFFAFLRKANVTVGKQHMADITKALQAGHVWVDDSTYTLWVLLTCTKTIQFGERKLLIPIRGIRGSPIDPIAMWRRHLTLSALPRAPKSHAFAYQERRGATGQLRWVNLTHKNFVTRLKAILLQHGLDSSRYASHSFRRGGATYAAACGVDPVMLKALGDWRSCAYLAYITISVKLRQTAAERIHREAARFMPTA